MKPITYITYMLFNAGRSFTQNLKKYVPQFYKQQTNHWHATVNILSTVTHHSGHHNNISITVRHLSYEWPPNLAMTDRKVTKTSYTTELFMAADKIWVLQEVDHSHWLLGRTWSQTQETLSDGKQGTFSQCSEYIYAYLINTRGQAQSPAMRQVKVCCGCVMWPKPRSVCPNKWVPSHRYWVKSCHAIK